MTPFGNVVCFVRFALKGDEHPAVLAVGPPAQDHRLLYGVLVVVKDRASFPLGSWIAELVFAALFVGASYETSITVPALKDVPIVSSTVEPTTTAAVGLYAVSPTKTVNALRGSAGVPRRVSLKASVTLVPDTVTGVEVVRTGRITSGPSAELFVTA